MGFSRKRSWRAVKAARQAKATLAADPRSYFYGDAVDVDPQTAADAISEGNADVTTEIAADQASSDSDATARAAAFQALSPSQKAQLTLLPPLAVWNAQVIQNPVVGKLAASNLDYNLTKNLNEMPYAGKTFSATTQQTAAGDSYYADVVISITDAKDTQTYGIPLMTFVISNSTLNAPVGGLVTLTYKGADVNGNAWDTITDASKTQYAYTFQRLNSTDPVRGVFIPFQVVATRTLPFMPVFKYDASAPKTITFRFSGLTATDTVYVNVLGYASQELKEIANVYNLPSGQMI